MNEDHLKKLQNLTEEFLKESEKMINEGWMDRASANLAGLGGSVQGLGQKIGGHAGKALGSVLGNKDMQKSGQQSINKSKNMAYDAKYNTYLDSIIKSVIVDLGKLNIQVKNPKQLDADIKKSIQTNTNNNIKQPAAKKSVAPVKQQAAPTGQPPKPVPVMKTSTGQVVNTKQPTTPASKVLGRKGYSSNPNVNPNYVKPNQASVPNKSSMAANAPVKSSSISQPTPKKNSKVTQTQQPTYNYSYGTTPIQPATQASQPATHNYGKMTKPKYNANTTFVGKDNTKN